MQPNKKLINELKDQIFLEERKIIFLQKEILQISIKQQLQNIFVHNKIKILLQQFQKEICSDIPNAFWDRKKHIVSLPYENDFDDRFIPTKAKPAQMKKDYLDLYKKEIQTLLEKQLIIKSTSPWSCTTFYANKTAEQERGVPRLVINYKPSILF